MSSQENSVPRRSVAVFDLDGTLTYRDTLLQFLASFLRAHPWRALRLWRFPWTALCFVLVDRDRGQLKSRVIRMVMGGSSRADVDTRAEEFVSGLMPRRRLRPGALAVLETHRAAGDRLVLLSASPDFYVPRIGQLLGFERTLCTEILWRGDRLDGDLKTPNRRGAEKSRCLEFLRAEYPGFGLVAYGNSASDLDHLRHADWGVLVNANAAARGLAKKWQIPTANWT